MLIKEKHSIKNKLIAIKKILITKLKIVNVFKIIVSMSFFTGAALGIAIGIQNAKKDSPNDVTISLLISNEINDIY